MDIGFLWDSEKRDKVRLQHDVRFHEVVAAFDDPDAVTDLDDEHADRYVMVARTAANRLLIVVFEVEALRMYRIVTAYDANQEQRDVYEAR